MGRGAPALGPEAPLCSEGGAAPKLNLGDVGRLRALLPLDDFELHPVALSEGLESRCLNCAEVNEDVGAAIARDETKALGVVEPLHGAGDACHAAIPLSPLRG